MQQRTVAVVQLILAGVLWSLGGILIKQIPLNPMAITSARSAISALVFLAYLKFKPKFTFSRSQIAGALCYVGTVSLFVGANKTTTAANAILLQYGAPGYVAFLAYFILGEKPNRWDILAVIGIALGMMVFFAGDVSAGQALGNVLAIVSGMTFAGLVVCLRLQKGGAQLETVLLGNIMAFAVGAPFLFAGPSVLPYAGPVLLLGVFQLGIPYVLYSLAAKNVTALDLIIIPTIEPILNTIWVFLGTGEAPGLFSVIGGLVVILVVAIRSVGALRENAEVLK